MTPYYEQSGMTIYHGDCLDVMECWEGLRTQPFDLLLTDPPYGLNEAAGKNKSRGGPFGGKKYSAGSVIVPATDYGHASWDAAPANEAISVARALARWAVIFGGNYYDLPPSRCWLVWDKDNSGDFADCELLWTNFNKAVRKLTYRWNGMLQQPGRPKEIREHPTQKPEAVVVWALGHAPIASRTVFDPFMGTGTTLVAAKRLGKQATGIEREERYCEIAARRLRQEALPLEL